jgi:cytochrome c oxidase subunit II
MEESSTDPVRIRWPLEWARMAAAWVVLSALLEILAGIVPIPPGTGSSEGSIEHDTIAVLLTVGMPIFALVCVVLGYSLLLSRRLVATGREPPALPESALVVGLWLGGSVAVVLFLASWGIFTLNRLSRPPASAVGAPAGQQRDGRSPALDVQVIGQEWYWAFRYPSYGGMESLDLYLPVDTPIHFHVTSLDVVHSFWIYDGGVKEDAVPGIANDVWMLARSTSSYRADGINWVKCNELCGAGHSLMHTGLYVVSRSKFQAWATALRSAEASSGLLGRLPAYHPTYYLPPHVRWPPPPQAATSEVVRSRPVDTTHVEMLGAHSPLCTAHVDCYNPAVIRVHLGQVVIWTNQDQDLHDAVATGGAFDTGILSSSATGIWVPRQTGIYKYFCTLHPYMQGEVIVVR